MENKPYLSIGNANDLTGRDRVLFRTLEILPGALAWGTFAAIFFLSWQMPVFTAFFIIAFDIYWLIKTVFLSFHLRSAYQKTRRHLKINWREKLAADFGAEAPEIYHLLILPFSSESFEILNTTFNSYIAANYDLKKVMVVLGTEKRMGEPAQTIARQIEAKYATYFADFLITTHPDDIIGEIAGKGSNETWMGKQAQKLLLDRHNLDYKKVLVSVFDIDTQIYPEYFSCLTWHYLKEPRPERASFQPIPIFNNNAWDAPFFSRVAAMSCTFWQMMQQARPERLATFSSQALTFQGAVDMGFWTPKNVSEDSRIFWKSLLVFDGDYRVVPLFYPVSMDANLAPTLWQTAKNVYKQQRRWGWGVENLPYFLYGCLKNKKIPLWDKLRHNFNQLEGFWSWSTNAIMIFLLGWLPLFLGGAEFNRLALSYNLPRLTRWIMTLAMIGIITSIFFSLTLMPERPAHYKKSKYIFLVFQWLLFPINLVFFGCIPGLDAQTRLMLGKYMGFWVTPKTRIKV